MIDVHYWPTPNGWKVTIMLEETGLPYRIVPVDIGGGDQFKADFLRISPNNRMPAIVDSDPIGGGGPLSVFESGAILEYLADKTGQFLPKSGAGRYKVLQWVHWQMANLGPNSGQNNHFSNYAVDKIPYAMDRYRNEVNRLYGVLDRRLAKHEYMAGDYSIADMASYPWISPYRTAPMDLEPYPEVRRWQATIAARPATARAYALATQVNPEAGQPLSDEQRKVLFGR